MRISMRAQGLPESSIRKLVPLADAAKKRGIHVYHLNIGQPDIKTPETFLNAVRAYNSDVLQYGPSNGLAEYREALERYYRRCGITVTSDEIFVTTAGSEALLFAIISVADPEDNILVMEPFYTNYNGFGAQVNVQMRGITTSAENGFAIPDIAAFKDKLDDRTRAILLCNPNNPTGAVYPKEDIARLVQFACEQDLYIISDEVYREFIYDGLRHTSVLQFSELGDRAIMVDSVSKRYSACGARIGCLVTHNRELLNVVMRLGQARLCPPTLEQIGAAAAVDTPDSYLNAVISEYQKRRDVLFEGLQSIPGVFVRKPQGAFYIMANLPVEDAEDFARFMLTTFSLDNRTVMVAPGTGFYATSGMGSNQIRAAYVLNRKYLQESVEILAAGLSAYTKQN